MLLSTDSRWVMVETRALDDLLALALAATERLELKDALLAREMLGSIANVRAHYEGLRFPDGEV